MAEPMIPAEELVTLLNEVAESAILRHSNGDETFLECRLCGEWEGHKASCPYPAIEQWLLQTPDEAATEKTDHEHAWRLNKHGRICVLCLEIQEGKGPHEP